MALVYSCEVDSFVKISDTDGHLLVFVDCEQKLKYVKQFKIKFAYTKPFSCDSFIEKGKSSEGLVLYIIL